MNNNVEEHHITDHSSEKCEDDSVDNFILATFGFIEQLLVENVKLLRAEHEHVAQAISVIRERLVACGKAEARVVELEAQIASLKEKNRAARRRVRKAAA